MYRKDSVGWIKHMDFIILDLICLQVAFVLAYALSGYGVNPYRLILYRNMAVYGSSRSGSAVCNGDVEKRSEKRTL